MAEVKVAKHGIWKDSFVSCLDLIKPNLFMW